MLARVPDFCTFLITRIFTKMSPREKESLLESARSDKVLVRIVSRVKVGVNFIFIPASPLMCVAKDCFHESSSFHDQTIVF